MKSVYYYTPVDYCKKWLRENKKVKSQKAIVEVLCDNLENFKPQDIKKVGLAFGLKGIDLNYFMCEVLFDKEPNYNYQEEYDKMITQSIINVIQKYEVRTKDMIALQILGELRNVIGVKEKVSRVGIPRGYSRVNEGLCRDGDIVKMGEYIAKAAALSGKTITHCEKLDFLVFRQK